MQEEQEPVPNQEEQDEPVTTKATETKKQRTMKPSPNKTEGGMMNWFSGMFGSGKATSATATTTRSEDPDPAGDDQSEQGVGKASSTVKAELRVNDGLEPEDSNAEAEDTVPKVSTKVTKKHGKKMKKIKPPASDELTPESAAGAEEESIASAPTQLPKAAVEVAQKGENAKPEQMVVTDDGNAIPIDRNLANAILLRRGETAEESDDPDAEISEPKAF